MNRVSRKMYRDGLILVLLGFLAVAGPLIGHPMKFDGSKRVGFEAMIPTTMGEWDQVSSSEFEKLPEELNINELYQALYSHPTFGRVALTLEFTSDSRREFELHFPDICHRIRGDRVVSYPPGRLNLSDGRSIEVAIMDWRQANGGYSAVTAYWYVTADGITIDSMNLKIKQALAGLFARPGEAVMVRFDAFYEDALSPKNHTELLTAIHSLNQHIESEIDSRANTMIYQRIKTEEI